MDDSSDIPQKRCCKCKQFFPATLELFYSNKGMKDGLSPDCKSCHRAYCTEHKATIREADRKTYMKHREKRIDQMRNYREAHREEMRLHDRLYATAHREERRQYLLHYRVGRQEQYKVYWRRRRARKLGNGGTHTSQDIARKLKAQHRTCYYCHKKFDKTKGKYVYHVDHVIPLSRGGSDDTSNLVLTCPPCNLSKYNKLLHEWPEGGRLF